jgi:hypothetical protein
MAKKRRMSALQRRYFGPKRRRVTTVARRKSYRRGKAKMKIPVLILAGAVPGIVNVFTAFKEAGPEWAMKKTALVYGGYDVDSGVFNAAWLRHGTYPLVIGAIVSKLASKFGLNKVFKGLPIRF